MPRRPEMTDFRRTAALPPGAVAGGARAPDRLAADRAESREGRCGPSGAASRSTTRARPARTSSPPARSRRREPGRPSSSLTRASTTSGCGPTSSGRRRWRFNLFGDLAADLELADRAVHAWWPDAPGTVRDVRFAHSPGRFDPAYLGSLRAFDAAFVLDLDDGTQGIVGVDTEYHERAKPETPKPSNLRRYLEVAERSGAFAPGAIDAVKGTERSRRDVARAPAAAVDAAACERQVGWGRYVVVHPAGNTDFADACSRYRASSWTSRRSPR